MTLGPILVSGENPIIGPLRVKPYNYPDSVNGTLHDPTWTSRNKDYIAYVDDTNPGTNVGFTKTGPFWSLHPFLPPNNSTVMTNLEYWNCGHLQNAISVPFIHTGAVNPACWATVDGNGYFYQHGVKEKVLPGYTGLGISVVRRVKSDGSYITVEIDWQDLVPPWTLPSGYEVDPYEFLPDPLGNNQIFPERLYDFLPQNDGVLVRCVVLTIDPTNGGQYSRRMWLHVDENGNYGNAWWEPLAFIFGLGDINVVAACPLGEGYIGGRGGTLSSAQRIYKVNQEGNITQTGTPPITYSAALNSGVYGSTSQTFPIHSDGSFWIGSQAAGIYLLDGFLNNITPGWMGAADSQIYSFIVTAAPPLDPAFRMATMELVGGQWYHRVRRGDGTILVEVPQGPSISFTHAMYNLRTNSNCFLYQREGPPFGQYGVSNNGIYKFTADNMISVPVARGRLSCYPHGEFPNIDYSDWPLT